MWPIRSGAGPCRRTGRCRRRSGQGWRLDITGYLPAKRQAIQAHRSQYGQLIIDDPSGFQLPPELLSVFDNPFETFVAP